MTLPLSGPIDLYAIADEFGIAHTSSFPAGFYGLGGAPTSGPLSFTDFYGRSNGPLAASVPSSTHRTNLSANQTSDLITCTPTGGRAPYTFLWSKVSGGAVTIMSPTEQSTAFQATGMVDGETRSAVFKCTVHDDAGAVVDSNTCTATFQRVSI